MGILNRKQKQQDDGVLHFFDDYFREDLRKRGRDYFEKVIDESGLLFKKDLDATVAEINKELHEHITKQLDAQLSEQLAQISQVNEELKKHVVGQLDEQFVEYGKTIKEAQAATLQALTQSAQAMQQQQQQLTEALQKNVAAQEALMGKAYQQNSAELTAMKSAQDAALQSLNATVQAMQQQQQQLTEALQKNVAHHQEVLVNAFEQNMAQVIEQYLLGALGEQYDVKAQLPSIIKQMEMSKQEIVDDMKL